MKRWIFRIILFLIAILVIAFVWIWYLSPGTTMAIYDIKGEVKTGSIASLEKVILGGVEQWVLLRGEDKQKPVLLILHGGPGVAEMLMYREYLSELEKHFVVVNWDQQGAGKSYNNKIPVECMNVEHFVSNTIELTEWLKKRFNQNKIYLLGHSWGSILGIKAIQKQPESYSAYIGVGQFVNFIEGERISYDFALKTAKEKNIAQAVKELENIGRPPYKNDIKLVKTQIERKWITMFGANTYGKTGYSFLIPILLNGREYTISEKMGFFMGINFSLNLIWSHLTNVDFFIQAKELNVPVYFCAGRHDYTVPSILAERYFLELKAPKKDWIWFENSAHNPHFEEPEKFVDYLINTVLKETYSR